MPCGPGRSGFWSGSSRRRSAATSGGGGTDFAVLRLVAVPMVLHGLYDTILKKNLDEMALIVGLLSFVWFAWQIESAREFEQKATRALAAVPA